MLEKDEKKGRYNFIMGDVEDETVDGEDIQVEDETT